MVSLKQIIALIIAILAFVYTFYAMGKFMIFLSMPFVMNPEHIFILELFSLDVPLVAVCYNCIFTIMFMIQHSAMKTKVVKTFFHKLGLDIFHRACYSLMSALSLLFVVENWMRAPMVFVWHIELIDSWFLYWMFALVHVFAWMIIYGGCIIMDLPEIIGIKQVYYDMKNLAPPMTFKSFELQHLYGNVRHPSFVGFTTILWFYNYMSIDRFMLAVMLTSYMYVSWRTDHNDVIYQRCQLQKKREELAQRKN